jgi:hypothetical protein
MNCYFTSVRKAIIKKQKINSNKDTEKKRSLMHCGRECKLLKPLWRIVFRFLQKPKINLPYDPAILLLVI